MCSEAQHMPRIHTFRLVLFYKTNNTRFLAMQFNYPALSFPFLFLANYLSVPVLLVDPLHLFTKQLMLSSCLKKGSAVVTYPAFPFPFPFPFPFGGNPVLLVDLLYKATDAQRKGIAVA